VPGLPETECEEIGLPNSPVYGIDLSTAL